MTLWRLLDLEITYDAARNLAIDEAILQARIKRIAPPTLRFWRNKESVIIGRSQKVCAEINLEEVFKKKIQVIKRFSGGGAVYHDLGNLNYTIVLDEHDPLVKGLDITESYNVLCSGVIRGLEILGLSSINFVPPGNIFISQKKVSGSAQLRRKNVILHHGTLLINSDLDALRKVLTVYNEEMKKESTSKWSPVTNISDELKREISISEIKDVLIQGFKETLHINLNPGNLTREEEEMASEIYHAKYQYLI